VPRADEEEIDKILDNDDYFLTPRLENLTNVTLEDIKNSKSSKKSNKIKSSHNTNNQETKNGNLTPTRSRSRSGHSSGDTSKNNDILTTRRDEKLPDWAYLGSHKIDKGYGGKYFEQVKVDQSFLSQEKVSTRRQVNTKTTTLKPIKRKRKSKTQDENQSAKLLKKKPEIPEIKPFTIKGVFDPSSQSDNDTKQLPSPTPKKPKLNDDKTDDMIKKSPTLSAINDNASLEVERTLSTEPDIKKINPYKQVEQSRLNNERSKNDSREKKAKKKEKKLKKTDFLEALLEENNIPKKASDGAKINVKIEREDPEIEMTTIKKSKKKKKKKKLKSKDTEESNSTLATGGI